MNFSKRSCWCDDLTAYKVTSSRIPLPLFLCKRPPTPKKKERKKHLSLSLNCIHIAREVSLFQSFLYNLVRGTTMDV